MVVGEEGADLGLEVGDLSSELLNAAGEQMRVYRAAVAPSAGGATAS